MIQVRRAVFETNSSSMHSIAVMKNNSSIKTIEEAMEEDGRLTVKDGNIVIRDVDDLEFSWGFDIVDTFYGRLAYAIASTGGHIEAVRHEITDAVKELFPSITGITLPMDKYSNEEKETTGYVDHESHGTLHHFLRTHNLTLAEYLADRNILVIIDNDNGSVFEEVMGCGMFDEDAIANKEDYEYDLMDVKERIGEADRRVLAVYRAENILLAELETDAKSCGEYLYIDNKGEVVIWSDELDWASDKFKVAFSVYEKLVFLMAHLCGCCYNKDMEVMDVSEEAEEEAYMKEIKEVMQKTYPGDSENMEMHPGFRQFRFSSEIVHQGKDTQRGCVEIDPFYGFVCKEASDFIKHYLKSNGVTISEFATNPKYVAFADDGNLFDKMVKHGFLSLGDVKIQEGIQPKG